MLLSNKVYHVISCLAVLLFDLLPSNKVQMSVRHVEHADML